MRSGLRHPGIVFLGTSVELQYEGILSRPTGDDCGVREHTGIIGVSLQ